MEIESVVYVLDSDERLRETVRGLVQGLSFRCRCFASGLEFLDTYRADAPGCLLMDVRIMDITGSQMQRRLAEQGAPLPVVFLSGNADIRTVVKALKAGALNFLQKPCREQELWEAIHEAIDLSRIQLEKFRRHVLLRKRLDSLNKKDHEVLQGIRQNKSTRDIAGELGVTQRAIEIRRRRMMRKLTIQSPTELLRFAEIAGECAAAGQGSGNARQSNPAPTATRSGSDRAHLNTGRTASRLGPLPARPSL